MVFINKIFLILTIFFLNNLFATYDLAGKKFIHVYKKDLVFLGPGALRLGVYLGITDKIVGIEAIEKRKGSLAPYRTWLQKNSNINNLPIISQGGPGTVPSLEALIKSKAKLIIASFIEPSLAKLIEEKTKIPVFLIHYGSGYGGKDEKLKAFKKSLLALAKVTGVEKRAIYIINELKKEEENLKFFAFEKPLSYIGGMGYKGAQGICSTDSNYIPFQLLDLENKVTNKQFSHQQIKIEDLIRYNPDFIFLDKFGGKIIKNEKRNKINIFQSLKAFKEKNVFWLYPYNFYNTNIENSYINAWKILKAFKIKTNIDEDEKRILKIFYGNTIEY